MQLTEALHAIAEQLNLNADELIAYAAEDEIGGWPSERWPGGALWSVEGKTLYAITRAMQPAHILECGTREGCSATHLLTALMLNNSGHLISVDLCSITDISGAGFGGLVPPELQDRWTFRAPMSAETLLDADDTPFELVFEDTDHTFETTVSILTRLVNRAGVKVIISHDIFHPYATEAVRAAWTQVFGAEGADWRAYPIEPSDCGLAIWRNPNYAPTV